MTTADRADPASPGMADPASEGIAAQRDQQDQSERAAMRAFVQRCEVRLSTIHRVATALLSGAGILVLLPALERDAVISVVRGLLDGPLDLTRGLLIAAVLLSIVLAMVLLWMVVLQLTRFYFHANHIRRGDTETFTPRFTLTSLRLPIDELGPDATAEYETLFRSAQNMELLVPNNQRARSRIDRQLAAYPALAADQNGTDRARADALLELAAARRRPLLEEVVKIELGMARHVLRMQVVVLRYVKALLVVVVTVLANFVAAAAVAGQIRLTTTDLLWIAATFAIWSPATILVVTAPVRWLENLLQAEGALDSTVRDDPEFTHLEDVATYISLVAWVASMVALILIGVDNDLSTRAQIGAAIVGFGSATMLAVTMFLWRGHSRPSTRDDAAPQTPNGGM